MGCLDAVALADFAGNRLDGDAFVSARAHVEGCASCTSALRQLGQSDDTETGPGTLDLGGSETPTRESGRSRAEAPRSVVAGDMIGPYTIGDQLGEGGMGTVFTAHHRELDRAVALKLIRIEDGAAGDELAQSRLLREAQAMARLDDPNIVSVYDAGTWHGRVYLAMERVEGSTLKAWLARQPRTWREIRDAFVAAGRGVAAAHAAGIVHRDFKPSNVLVGTDGRIRVTDFGLARAVDAGAHPIGPASGSRDSDATAPSALSTPLTQVGAVMGTPGYMSPEQGQGQPGDARTDQFSFCVSMYAALYGYRPYTAKLAPTLGDAVRAVPKGTRVPRFLRRALMRGLAIDPAARFPTMTALLAEISRDPIRRVRRTTAIAAIAIALGSAFVLLRTRSERRESVGCEASAGLAGVWDQTTRVALVAAFASAGKPAATRNTRPVIAALDRYASAWTDLRSATCRSVSDGSADATSYLELACLKKRRLELATLVGVLARADADVAVTALDTVSRLRPPDRCADPRALASDPKPPTDPKVEAEVEAIRADLTRAHARFYGTNDTAERRELEVLERRAEATGYKPVEADVVYELGLVLTSGSSIDLAREALIRAEGLAEGGGADQQAGLTASWLANLELAKGHSAAGRQWLDRARILLERIGGDPDLESQIEIATSTADTADGHAEAAVEDVRRAVAVLSKSRGLDDQWTSTTSIALAIRLSNLQRYAEALDVTHQAVPALERELGAESSNVAYALTTQGSIEGGAGDYVSAAADLSRAQEIARNSDGAESPTYADALQQNTELRIVQGRGEDAIVMLHELEPIVQRVSGAESVTFIIALNQHGRATRLVGDFDAAATYERRALALADKVTVDPELVGEIRLELARDLRQTHQNKQVTALLEQAIIDLSKNMPAWEDLGVARLELARMLADTHGDLTRALALAREASADLTHVPWRKTEAAEVVAWLREHHAEP